jgi:D-xylose 1-dehydrogenase
MMTASAIYPSLAGKHVLITGGATGIGAAMVQAFAAQRAKVSFLDIDTQSGQSLAQSTGAIFYHCDLTYTEQLQNVIAQCEARAGTVHALINNAANDDRHTIESVSREYFDQRIAVNLSHQFFAIQAALPAMKKAGSGSIINLGSITSVLGTTGLPIYATAKGAVVGMTRALAKELGEYSIRVNCVIPGWVKTERQTKLWITPEAEAIAMKAQALKAWIMPEDLANMVVFLASDQARMCTAQCYTVDAGWT